MIDWTGDIFKKYKIRTIGFFTSGACSALWNTTCMDGVVDIKPRETRLLPGLPEEMALTGSDLKYGPPTGPPPGLWGSGFPCGPPGPGFFHGPLPVPGLQK